MREDVQQIELVIGYFSSSVYFRTFSNMLTKIRTSSRTYSWADTRGVLFALDRGLQLLKKLLRSLQVGGKLHREER